MHMPQLVPVAGSLVHLRAFECQEEPGVAKFQKLAIVPVSMEIRDKLMRHHFLTILLVWCQPLGSGGGGKLHI